MTATAPTSSTATPERHDLVVVVPCFGDWPTVPRLLGALDDATQALGLRCHVVVVNDGGTPAPDELAGQLAERSTLGCEVLELRRNLGHQRAIAIGLAYAEAHLSANHLLVMDADGEDDPGAIAQLYAAARHEPDAIVFAHRSERSEGLTFRTGYVLFKEIFRVLSGHVISFGNYSLIPWSMLRRLTVSPEIWVHYAAGVIRARLPYTTVPIPRAARYAGQSGMNLAGLILHGMAAISLFADVAAVRVMLFALGTLALSGLAIGVATALRLFTALATPGWATNVVIGMTLLIAQVMTLALIMVFVAFQQRTMAANALPCEIYGKYIDRVICLKDARAAVGD
jgi:hypothetical protein